MTTPNDALDFYPTPDSLAFDMVFSLREVKSGFTTYPKPILEPSAGDGALARQVHALAFSVHHDYKTCLLYTSPSPRDRTRSRMPSSA